MDPIPSILEILYGISWFLISPTLITVLAGAGTARILPRIYVTDGVLLGLILAFPTTVLSIGAYILTDNSPEWREIYPLENITADAINWGIIVAIGAVITALFVYGNSIIAEQNSERSHSNSKRTV